MYLSVSKPGIKLLYKDRCYAHVKLVVLGPRPLLEGIAGQTN